MTATAEAAAEAEAVVRHIAKSENQIEHKKQQQQQQQKRLRKYENQQGRRNMKANGAIFMTKTRHSTG